MSIDRVDTAGLTDADLARIRERALWLLSASDGNAPPRHRRALIDLLAALEASQAEVVRLRTARDEAERAYSLVCGSLADTVDELADTKVERDEARAKVAMAWDEGKRAGIEQMRPTNPYRAALAVTSPPSEPS